MQRREGNLVEGQMTALIAGHRGLLTGLISVKWRAARGKLLTTSSCGLTSRESGILRHSLRRYRRCSFMKTEGKLGKHLIVLFIKKISPSATASNYPSSPRGLSCLGIFFSQAVVFISDDCRHQELYRKIYRSLWCNEIPYNAFKLYEI